MYIYVYPATVLALIFSCPHRTFSHPPLHSTQDFFHFLTIHPKSAANRQ